MTAEPRGQANDEPGVAQKNHYPGLPLQEITRLGIPVQLTMFPERVGEVVGLGNEEREAGIATPSAKSSGPGPRNKTVGKVWRRQGRERSAADASLGVSEIRQALAGE